MKAVYKFPLMVAKLQRIKMPKNSTILTVQIQGQRVCLWALVDIDKGLEDRFFAIFETGKQVPENILRYVGTFQIPEENFVGHVFEMKGEDELQLA